MTDLLEVSPVTQPAYYKVTLDHDDAPENPSDWGGWKLVSFNRRHASFQHPDELILKQDDNGDPVGLTPGLRQKLRYGTAFWLSYYEHGDGTWSIYNGKTPGDQWDGTRIAGLLTYEAGARNLPKGKEDRQKHATSFLDTYNDYANGNVYAYSIERLLPSDDPDFDPDLDGDELETDDDFDALTSSGYYGEDDLASAVRERLLEAGFRDGDRIVYDGDSTWLEEYKEFSPFPAD